MSFGPCVYLYGNSLLKRKLTKHLLICVLREQSLFHKRRGDMLHNSFQSLVTTQGITTSYQWKKISWTHFILLSKYCGKWILRCTCTLVYHSFFCWKLHQMSTNKLAHFGIGSKLSKSRQNHTVLILKTQTQNYSGYCQQTRPMLFRDKTEPTRGRTSSHLCHNHLLCNLRSY